MISLHSRILFFCLHSFAFYVSLIYTENIAKLPFCSDDAKQTELVFVSTLDGKLSAVNVDGQLSWQIDTGPGSLLSSNIHKLELTNNGQWIRIIPSLSGSLYKFNGVTIDPIPISADSLLTSSFRYLDDLAVAGGREVRTYGLLLDSGKQLYECSLRGCRNTTEYSEEMDNVIIVERKTYTVRAVEPRTGLERWNFSVGQHDIKIPYLSCLDVNLKSTNMNISAILPEGLLIATKIEEATEILWQYKFDSPIVAVWRWNGREITPLNLFSSSSIMASKSKIDDPSIYVGMHNKQLYIHESTSMQSILQKSKRVNDEDSVIESQSLTKIPWKPVPAVRVALSSVEEDDSTALSVLYGSEYVNGNGYYLYTQNVATCGSNGTNSTSARQISTTFISWWKGAVIISIITIIAGNVLVYKYKMLSADLSKSQTSVLRKTSEVDDLSFSSRYIQEFDPISCLGKGGFGVVFQAKKKFDECHYAIKRITLPNKPVARDRMMREVKALAKLDHRNIVRYYNAWLESPPHDWQKKHDQEWIGDFSSLVDHSVSLPSLSNVRSSCAINVPQDRYSEPDLEFFKKQFTSDYGSSIVFEGSTALKSSSTNNNNDSSVIKNDSRLSDSHSLNLSVPAPMYLYIQMQLCCKESLKDWLNSCSVRDKGHSLLIFRQIVEAVEYVHFRGLIHRDLKPSNIFFSLDGEIKVGDFGLVTSTKEYDEENDILNTSLQKSHTNAVGTQLYMSPEQLNGQQYNNKVDIYSLGIIFFELLVPFKTEMERINILRDLRSRQYPKEFATSYKEFELLHSMLSDNPQERPTATGIREQLYLDETIKIEDPRFEFKVPVNL